MPQQVFDALDLFGRCGAIVWPVRLQRFGLLLQHGQPHGDVEPVDQVFAVRMQIFLHLPHIFTAVGHEDHLLVLLHPLRLHHLPDPLSRLLIVSLHEAEAFRRRNQVSFLPPERHHTAARDHFEIPLLVGSPHVAAVDTHRYRTVCELVASATGSTSFNKSTTFSNGIREAHLVSR